MEAAAFVSGLRTIGRHVTEWNASDYGKGQVVNCDMVVVSGTRGKGGDIVSDHASVGIPSIVIDYGYMDRVHGVSDWDDGYWQVGVGGLNRPPAFECPSDRMERLSVSPQEPSGGDIIIAMGQYPGDPSHGYSVREMQKWGQSVCDQHGAYWRGHPKGSEVIVDAPQADGDLSTWLGRAKMVHTISSNAGLDALIHGVPAVAERPDLASWGELSGYTHPGADRVAKTCNKLSYGQWKIEEMRSGEAATFILENLDRWEHGRA